MVCPVCGGKVLRSPIGRPRVYCSDRCRQARFRGTHPLGWQTLRDAGLEAPSLRDLLIEAGVTDPFEGRSVGG